MILLSMLIFLELIFFGVDALDLKIAQNFIDRVNPMAFGLNSFLGCKVVYSR